jgi:histone H1/5
MAQRSKKSSLLASLSSLPTDNASAEAAWRQALLLRELSRDERVTARKRRAEAEAAKEYAENEAITATKQLCSELQAQARMKLQEAEDTLVEAERVKNNADSYAARVQVNIDTELANASKIREDAETYSEEIQDGARTAAEALMSQTRAGADEMASRMRRETSEDIRKILTDVEVARASAEDELETQRILTETARVRAFSHGLAAENAEDELARTNKPEVKPAPVKRAKAKAKAAPRKAVAKKSPARKAKVTSIRKAA